MEIVKAEEFGIEKKQAQELIGGLPQITKERETLVSQFDSVIKMDIEDPATTKKARELRLLIQKNRTKGINVWHRTTKDYFLKGGQFVDAIKRKEVAINERMEADLLAIEKYAENKEKERMDKLQAEREEILSEFVDDASERVLNTMDEDVWNSYLATKKKAYLDRIEAEKKAEAERLAKEKAEAEERERIRKENERLKAEAIERDRLAKIEADKRAKEEAKKKAEYEAKLKAEREAREKAEAIERKKREKLEAELQARKQAEEKAKIEAEQKIQMELNKDDASKVKDLLSDLSSIKSKYEFKSKANQKMYSDVGLLIDKIINHINK